MSLTSALAWSAWRGLVLTLLAWPICSLLERAFHGLPSRRQPLALLLLLTPYCYPELVLGYAFRDFALAHPDWAEFLCAVLLLVRLIPIGTVALIIAPASPVSAEALYCRQLLCHSQASHGHRFELLRCYLAGPVRRAVPALALVFLVAFQEFELAALLQTSSWTDWFIAAERLGLDRPSLVRLAFGPVLAQAPLLILVGIWLSRAEPASPEQGATPFARRSGLIMPGLVLTILLIAGCLLPTILIGGRIVDGWSLLFQQRTRQRGLAWEIVGAALVALCASLVAWSVTGRFARRGLVLLIPGMLGSLLISLAGVALFQWGPLHRAYDTPVPWVCALTVWLLPRAALLRVWLQRGRRSESLHAAELLGDKDPGQRDRRNRLLWQLNDRSQVLAVGLLAAWAYCDLPTAYLLAPTGMASGLVRLYNFMHFGRSAALSAEASLFFGVPLAGLLILVLLRRRTA